LSTAKKARTSNIESRRVDWVELGKQDKKIANLREALKDLKAYRDLYFPPGSVVLTEEVED